MKKFIFAVVAVFSFMGVSHAEDNFVHLQYTFRDTVASQSENPNRQGVNFTVGRKLSDNLTVDLGEQFRTEKLNNDSGSSTTRLETGATYTYSIINNVDLYTRGGLGYKFTVNDDYAYYSFEPGVKVGLTPVLTVKAGYRFRDAFSDSYDEKTNTARLGAEYTLAKNQSVTLGIDRSYGSSEFIGYNAGYNVKF